MKDYTRYNYDELVNRITDLYESKTGSGNGYQGSTGQMLVELLADVTDHLHFMLERRSQESFLQTARLESSVWQHASELGYRPRRRVSASGEVLLRVMDGDVNVSPSSDIIIPEGTVIHRRDIPFVTTKEVVVSDNQANIPVRQGEWKERNFNFDEEYQGKTDLLIEDFSDIEEFSLVISDSFGDEWKDVRLSSVDLGNVTSLMFASGDDKVYDIKYGMDGMRIVFGDDTYGKAPRGVITVKYLSTQGEEAPFIAAGKEMEMEDDKITDISSNEYDYEMESSSPIFGGRAVESIDDVRKYAPMYIKTANRAVTSDDYRFWITRSGIGDIADLSVFSEHDTRRLVYTMNNVFVCYITNEEVPLNQQQRKDLRKFIDNYKTITNHIVFMEANKLRLAFDITAKKFNEIPITDEGFYEAIKSRVGEYLDAGGSIGREFIHSKFIQYMEKSTREVAGVIYPLFDFIHADVYVEFNLNTPPKTYETSIRLSPLYQPRANDYLEVTIDSNTVYIPINSSQSQREIMEELQQQVGSLGFMTALVGDELYIRSPNPEQTFTLVINPQSVAGRGARTSIVYNVPVPNEDDGEYAIYPGSAKILDKSRTVVLFEDNGRGELVSSSGNTIRVDYRSGRLMSPNIAQEETILRYQQNTVKNVFVKDDSSTLLAPFADSFNDRTAGASTVTIL